MMYAEGPDESGLVNWIDTVQGMQYKYFQCAKQPSLSRVNLYEPGEHTSFKDVGSLSEFGKVMRNKGLTAWWKAAMGWEARGQ